MAPDGSDLRRIETDPFLPTSGLAWSIDGTHLYNALFAPGRAGLYGADVESGRDGRTNIAVISDPSDARSAAWRPSPATGPHGAAQTAAH